jgi:hypothetical protein
MERVAFLVEGTSERIDCQLNPETVEVARVAGVRPRGTATGRLVGAGMADDPLHFTGGGRTELRLDLLFDVDAADTTPVPVDVRALTRRLWMLAENAADEAGSVRPPSIRFVWGKSWNVPAVVAAVAERFDRFDADGVPRRSWLRLKLLRVADTAVQAEEQFEAMRDAQIQSQLAASQPVEPGAPPPAAADEVGSAVVAVGDAAPGDDPPAVRFDLLATDALGHPMLWRRLAAHNGIDDPTAVPPGAVLVVPPELERPRAGTSASTSTGGRIAEPSAPHAPTTSAPTPPPSAPAPDLGPGGPASPGGR